MHGNAWEWCRDWFADKLTGGTDPVGPAAGTHRVDRSGGWEDGAKEARSANRDRSPADERNNDLGFRVALVSVRKAVMNRREMRQGSATRTIATSHDNSWAGWPLDEHGRVSARPNGRCRSRVRARPGYRF